jgi:short-subunit dehydrogenase
VSSLGVTRSASIAPLPLAAVYTASKAAIESFSASLALELGAFDVRVKLLAFARPAMVTKESDVAETVWYAANDASGTLRFPAGPDAVALTQAS